MRGDVAGLAYVLEPPPQVVAHDVPEVPGVHEAREPVVIGHDQRAVHGVHPLDGSLQRPAAVHNTRPGVDVIYLLRRHRRVSKGAKLRVEEEKVEVGHVVSPHL